MGGGLKERPLTENGGRLGDVWNGPSLKRQGILELKITNIFFGKGVFDSGTCQKRGVFRSGPG